MKSLKILEIYGLINNAGIANTKLLHEETYEDINRIVNTNLIGSLNISRAVIPKMIHNKCGRIVNIASALGYRPLSYVGAYSATKAALIQVTKSQSIELARYNICVNAIAPGYIMTDINRHQLEGEAGEMLKKKIPLRRFADINELDLLISMLLNRKNSYMTGSIITIDGGLSAGCNIFQRNLMEYKLSNEIEQLRIKTREFVNDIIIPLESDKSSYDDHENINQTLLDNIRETG